MELTNIVIWMLLILFSTTGIYFLVVYMKFLFSGKSKAKQNRKTDKSIGTRTVEIHGRSSRNYTKGEPFRMTSRTSGIRTNAHIPAASTKAADVKRSTGERMIVMNSRFGAIPENAGSAVNSDG